MKLIVLPTTQSYKALRNFLCPTEICREWEEVDLKWADPWTGASLHFFQGIKRTYIYLYKSRFSLSYEDKLDICYNNSLQYCQHKHSHITIRQWDLFFFSNFYQYLQNFLFPESEVGGTHSYRYSQLYCLVEVTKTCPGHHWHPARAGGWPAASAGPPPPASTSHTSPVRTCRVRIGTKLFKFHQESNRSTVVVICKHRHLFLFDFYELNISFSSVSSSKSSKLPMLKSYPESFIDEECV